MYIKTNGNRIIKVEPKRALCRHKRIITGMLCDKYGNIELTSNCCMYYTICEKCHKVLEYGCTML